jgi:hypothetical protein
MGHPKKVIIIRHAEKPGDPSVDDAVDGAGLSTRGQVRAAALSIYVPAALPRPDFLFAANVSKHSKRPIETVAPLSQLLNVPINSQYKDTDFQSLANHLLEDAKYVGNVVLICWHHGRIPQLTGALGAVPPSNPWPGAVFDRLWVLDYAAGARPGEVPVEDKPQKLLFGDSKT